MTSSLMADQQLPPSRRQAAARSPRLLQARHGGFAEYSHTTRSVTRSPELQRPKAAPLRTSPEPLRNPGSVVLGTDQGQEQQGPGARTWQGLAQPLRSPVAGTRSLDMVPNRSALPDPLCSPRWAANEHGSIRGTDLEHHATALTSKGLQSPTNALHVQAYTAGHGHSQRSTASPTADVRSTPAAATRRIGTPASHNRSILTPTTRGPGTPTSDFRNTLASVKASTISDLPSTPASVTRSIDTPSSAFRSIPPSATPSQGTPTSVFRSTLTGTWQVVPENLPRPTSDIGTPITGRQQGRWQRENYSSPTAGIQRPGTPCSEFRSTLRTGHGVKQGTQECYTSRAQPVEGKCVSPLASTTLESRGKPMDGDAVTRIGLGARVSLAECQTRASSAGSTTAPTSAVFLSDASTTSQTTSPDLDAPELVWSPKLQIENDSSKVQRRLGGALGRSLSPVSAVFDRKMKDAKVTKDTSIKDLPNQQQPSLDDIVDQAFGEELYNSGVAAIGVGAVSLLAFGSFAL